MPTGRVSERAVRTVLRLVRECFLRAILSIDLIKIMVYYIGMDVFSALADPTRRNIMELLAARGQLRASDIYKQFSVSHPAISQHLQVLREAKLVTMEKHAQERLYMLNPATMEELEVWVHTLTERWNERFDRLDEILEQETKKSKKRRK